MTRNNEEERLQAAIVQVLKLTAFPTVHWWHTPNGEYRSKRTAGRLKAMGVVAGAPDLCFTLSDGRSAFMEVKREGGYLSKEQRAWRDKCVRNGSAFVVVRSIDDALETLREWNVIPAANAQRSAA